MLFRSFYQDTTGGFRPERLVEMGSPKNMKLDFLDQIQVSRVTNVKEQQKSLEKIRESDYSLIVIDNVTDLFSFEYPNEEQILEKTNQFSIYMKNLALTTFETKIPVVLTNMIRRIDSSEQENMDSIISLHTHIKIKLSKKENSYVGHVFFNPMKTNQFFYKLTSQGLSSLP